MERRPGHVRVICVGSLYPRKRQTDLVQAVTALTRRNVECVLIGEHNQIDPPGDELVRARPETFTLTGGLQPEAVHAWYRGSDIFCLPSSDESMGISPIEAAWHGIPVVLADLECYEGIWRHGINALIHPVGDVEMLAWYLRMLLTSPSLRERFTKAGRKVALRFSEQRSGSMFDCTLREAIAAFG